MNRRQFVRGAMAAGAGMTAVAAAAETRSVADTGAVGDGRADDTGAIQKAIDGGAGVVALPKGTYRITRPLIVELSRVGPTSIVGAGPVTVIMEGAGPAFHIIGTHERSALPEGFSEQVWEQERLPIIAGIEIRGGHADSIGVRLERTMQATLTDLLVRRCRIGIHLYQRNRNVIISHCHVYHNLAIGILFDHVNLHQAIIADSHISYNPLAGIKLLGGEMRNFQIVGNDIEYNHDEKGTGSADILIDMREEGSFREGTIVGNTIQAKPSPAGANLRFLGGEGLRSGGLLAVTGNLIGSQTDNVHLADCRGVTLTGNSLYSADARTIVLERCANVVVSSNTIDWNPDHRGKQLGDGITIEDCDGVQLTGVIIEDCFAGTPQGGGAIDVSRSRDVSVTDCQVLDPRHRGIVLADAVRCRVSGCTVVDRRERRTMRESIQVAGDSRDNLIEGNIVSAGSLGVPEGLAVARGNLEVAGE